MALMWQDEGKLWKRDRRVWNQVDLADVALPAGSSQGRVRGRKGLEARMGGVYRNGLREASGTDSSHPSRLVCSTARHWWCTYLD